MRQLEAIRTSYVIPAPEVQQLRGVNFRVNDFASGAGARDFNTKKCRAFDRSSAVSNLSPLKGMKLMELNCGGTAVSDLSPLQGMPLTGLSCTSHS